MKRLVVIGGGHNGLAAAALLAKRGLRVTLLEARAELGGLCAPLPITDGFVAPGILHDTRGLRRSVVSALGLERHGLSFEKTPRVVCAPSRDAEPIWLEGPDGVRGVSDADRAAYQRLYREIFRIRAAVSGLLDQPPPDPTGELWPLVKTAVGVRRLGARPLLELLRLGPMCVADWMRDTFTSERLGAALAVAAIEGTFMGPWSAGTAGTLLLRELYADRPEIAGGPAALIAALAKAAASHGVEIRTEATVASIELKGGAAQAVVLADGERIPADRILSTIDPKQCFLELCGVQRLPDELAEDLRQLRVRGTTAKVHLALSRPLKLASGEAVSVLRTGETLAAVERAFDPVKYGESATTPVIEARVYDADDAEGQVVSVLVHHVLAGADHDLLAAAVIAELAAHCPDVSDNIVGQQVLTPADLEAEFRLTGGHIHHGEHAPDQLLFMRPSVSCSHYATPVAGLYLGGSGSHPGGGVTCAPGALAAAALA